MPSTTIYKRGQVIVVNVPFSNHTESSLGPRWLLAPMPSTATCRTLLSVRLAVSLAIISAPEREIVRCNSGVRSGYGIRVRSGFPSS
jgi:hypothetical protein